jgi:hypothetical protein
MFLLTFFFWFTKKTLSSRCSWASERFSKVRSNRVADGECTRTHVEGSMTAAGKKTKSLISTHTGVENAVSTASRAFRASINTDP